MRGLVVAVATLLVGACTQASNPVAATSPRPTPTATASAVVDLPVTKVSFACRLPALQTLAGGDSVNHRGGFISFPAGTFEADPAGGIHTDSVSAQLVTSAAPVLHGIAQAGQPFYDLAAKRWVPVGANQTSPDGAQYAYGVISGSTNPNGPYVIHLVDAVRASDQTFTIPYTPDFGSAIGPSVDDFDGASVYFSSQQTQGPPLGVWRLDVASGSVHELTKAFSVAAVEGGTAWLTAIDPRDPQGPLTGRSGPRANSVVRLDLASGRQTVWYFVAGHQVSLLGVDRLGTPVISDAAPPSFNRPSLHLVSKPESEGITTYDGSGGLYFTSMQSDIQYRLWLGNPLGIYLWTPAAGLQKVFAYTHDPVDFAAMSPAGLCL